MAEDIYKEFIDGTVDASLWHPGVQNVLDSQQRDEDEGGSDRLHVGCGLSAVGLLQLGDQNSDDVEEEQKVHLDRSKVERAARWNVRIKETERETG